MYNYIKVLKLSLANCVCILLYQLQTWFGSAPHLAYGIQLLPLTPISERRDAHDWAKQLYPSFAESCSINPDCTKQGW